MTARLTEFLKPCLVGVAGALTLLLAACSPTDMVAYSGGNNRDAPTGVVYMAYGLKLNPSFIQDVESPAATRVSDLRKFYKDQDFYTTFYRSGSWTRAAAQAFSALKGAEREGLSPEAYLPTSLLLAPRLTQANPQEVDVQLTAGLMSYLADLNQGAHNPNPKKIGPDLMRQGVERADFAVFLNSVAPQGRSYRKLREVLNGRAGPVNVARKRQIAATMERLRWDHEAVGAARDIRVNIASQSMEIFERGNLVRAMSVVVGRTSRKTPVLQDEIVSLKFSPDWTAPRSIVQEDYLNRAQSDSAYFDQKGWQVYQNGQRTTSAAIDWDTVDLDNVTVRQPSGASNALGGVRFSLTNSQAIYLHDTNAHSLFQKATRLFSSGCVRVEDAGWLAHWIMRGERQPMSMDQVRKNMDLGSPKTVRLDTSVPVSIAYMTVWVDGANKLHWEEDVYGHDRRLMKKMRFPTAWGGGA